MYKTLTSATVAMTLLCGSALAAPMSQEQMAETILALQARVEALEARSRRDRSDAEAARAELRAVKGAPRRVVREPGTAAPVTYASAPPTVVTSATVPSYVTGFDGLYGAAIGGYQFSTTKTRQNLSFNFSDDADPQAASGGNIGAAFGYNATSGPLLIGGELRFRKLFDETRSLGFYQVVFGSQNDTPLTARFSREYGGDLSMRAGFIFEDNLIYARIGGGADALRHVYPQLVSSPPSGAYAPITKRETTASPYAVIGLGVERNFGPWFARIEGAFLDHFEIRPDAYARSSYFTTEISSAIGYRF